MGEQNQCIIVKYDYIYIFGNNSVVVYKINDSLKQVILFNVESSHHYKQFGLFLKVLKSSEKYEYDNIVEIYALAAKYNVGAVIGHKPENLIAFSFNI